MAEDFVQVAPDSSGAKVRTRSHTVGANTVEDQFVIPTSARTRTGLYRVDSGQLSITAAADAATAGKWWLVNPSGSAVAIAVKSILITTSASAATVMPTAPVLSLERMTWASGTPSGATVTPAKRVRTAVAGLAADATAVGSIRLANTSMTTPAAGESVRAWDVPAILTAVGTYGDTFLWDPNYEDEEIILAALEGLILRQSVAGTTSDVRKFNVSVTWEEFTAP